ncbi:MAG: hypothetical protein CNLJKLNK_00620 [Holosporales bacterium]
METNTSNKNEDTAPPALPDGVHQFKEGEQIVHITFKNGEKNGPLYVFQNGLLTTEMSFVDNVLHGLMKCYFPNNTVQLVQYYKAGILEGDFIQYHPNGAIQMKLTYQKGLKQGLCTIYDPYGNLQQDMTYQNDLLDGPINSYYDGKMVARKYYKDGVEVIPPEQ